MSFLLQRATVTQDGDQNFEEPAVTDRIIALADIRVDGGTQMRAGLDDATVAEYAEAITGPNSWPFPAVVVYHDGAGYWLADGFHRVAAAKRYAAAQKLEMAIPASIRSGTRRDAILHAASANATHGLRRTNADKRRAVETLLRDDEWSQWSNREIARRCHVDEKTVRTVRSELTAEIPQSELAERIYKTKHGTTATMNTANIGANPPRAITYGALCLLIEREIAPTCDLWPADMDWLVQYVGDAVHRKHMTASEQDIMTAIIDTREDLRSRQEREDRLSRARAAAEAADAQRSDLNREKLPVPESHRPEASSSRGLTYNQNVELVHQYWSKRELEDFERSDNHIAEIRRYMVDHKRGRADGTWRIETGQGQIRAWLSQYGDYWHREPDGVYSYDEFAKMTAAFLPPRPSSANEQPAVEQSDHDPYDHPHADAIRNDLAAMDNELDPAAQERYRLTIIERALLELARSFGRGRFSVTVNLGDEESEWLVHAWEPGYPLDGAAHLHEAVAALREQLGEQRG